MWRHMSRPSPERSLHAWVTHFLSVRHITATSDPLCFSVLEGGLGQVLHMAQFRARRPAHTGTVGGYEWCPACPRSSPWHSVQYIQAGCGESGMNVWATLRSFYASSPATASQGWRHYVPRLSVQAIIVKVISQKHKKGHLIWATFVIA